MLLFLSPHLPFRVRHPLAPARVPPEPPLVEGALDAVLPGHHPPPDGNVRAKVRAVGRGHERAVGALRKEGSYMDGYFGIHKRMVDPIPLP